jgi:hypothetical protein
LQEVRAVHAAFNGVMRHDPGVTDQVFLSAYDELTRIFRDSPTKDTFEFGIKHIVSVAGAHQNEESVGVVVKFLERLILANLIPAR